MMSPPALNGLVATALLFSLLAAVVGLMLDRAARAPGLATATVAMLVFGLSWGGLLLIGE